MAMTALRGQVTTQAEQILSGAPARCDELLKARSALEGARPSGESLDVPASMSQAFDVLDTEVHGVARDLGDIAAYIRLHIPVHEDGNNFYVDMQDGVAKVCEESIKKVSELADLRVQYLEKRADMKEKVLPSVSTDTHESTSSSKSTEVAKETEEKRSDGTSSKTDKKTCTREATSERKEAIVRLDQAWHGRVVRALSLVAYELAKTTDMATKNKNKILDPRGEDGRGSKQGAMFY
jgi:hypothetical protein